MTDITPDPIVIFIKEFGAKFEGMSDVKFNIFLLVAGAITVVVSYIAFI